MIKDFDTLKKHYDACTIRDKCLFCRDFRRISMTRSATKAIEPAKPKITVEKIQTRKVKQIIAIDFDGVIHDKENPVEGRRMGPPMEGAKQAIEHLVKEFIIVIHSVWADKPKVIEDWMNYYEIPYDEVSNIKPNAKFYIDDKAIHFNNWAAVMNKIYGNN